MNEKTLNGAQYSKNMKESMYSHIPGNLGYKLALS